MFIKTGDKVKVIAGKDKGKEGIVSAVFPKKNRVLVEGINIMKKHQKPSAMGEAGGIVEMEASIDASNVMLIDASTGEPTRVGFKVEDGKKVRVSKKTGEVLN
ncbi:MAG: 50S ribosomal protein L24 [Pisciglobus halotolerans]|nr:50S ribosomal protein L24 [Pisciglobus halotolerans]